MGCWPQIPWQGDRPQIPRSRGRGIGLRFQEGEEEASNSKRERNRPQIPRERGIGLRFQEGEGREGKSLGIPRRGKEKASGYRERKAICFRYEGAGGNWPQIP